MAFKECEEVPHFLMLAVNSPFFGLNGYDDLFEPHLAYWKGSVPQGARRILSHKNIAGVMRTMLGEIVDDVDGERFQHFPDGPERQRVHRLEVLGMSTFLKEMTAGFANNEGVRMGKVTLLLDFLWSEEEEHFGYRLFVTRAENPSAEWFEGEGVFVRQTLPPASPTIDLMERLMGRGVSVNFDAMTTVVPYLKSQIA